MQAKFCQNHHTGIPGPKWPPGTKTSSKVPFFFKDENSALRLGFLHDEELLRQHSSWHEDNKRSHFGRLRRLLAKVQDICSLSQVSFIKGNLLSSGQLSSSTNPYIFPSKWKCWECNYFQEIFANCCCYCCSPAAPTNGKSCLASRGARIRFCPQLVCAAEPKIGWKLQLRKGRSLTREE